MAQDQYEFLSKDEQCSIVENRIRGEENSLYQAHLDEIQAVEREAAGIAESMPGVLANLTARKAVTNANIKALKAERTALLAAPA